jgi:hypothetical protein
MDEQTKRIIRDSLIAIALIGAAFSADYLAKAASESDLGVRNQSVGAPNRFSDR